MTRTHCVLISLLVVRCNSSRTTQRSCFGHYHHVGAHKSWSRIKDQPSTFLCAGRERRISTSKNTNDVRIRTAEQKLVSDEEAARQQRLGQMKQRLQKEVNREDRISALEFKLNTSKTMSQFDSEEYMSKAERAELEGLLKVRDNFEEQYNPEIFTKAHLEFKAMHNDAFIQLSKYCVNKRKQSSEPANFFFLDGPDGATASALIHKGGFDPSQCYVANRHKSSCESLRISGGGLLPDENFVYATASEALTISAPISGDGVGGCSGTGEDGVDFASLNEVEDGAFAHKDFAAYYFDGCGGFVPHIIGMLSAALLGQNTTAAGPIAVGYSLLGGNRNIVTKELAVSRVLTIIARRRGMRMVHVLDDPLRYGLSPDIQKIGGANDGTFTTWLLLQDGD